MLLRSLSNLIKPSNEQLRNKTNGQFTRLKIWLYQLLLRRLLKSYLHYAISDSIIINNGDRIAQLILAPVYQANFCCVEELSDTQRGTGGFGSTGVSS